MQKLNRNSIYVFVNGRLIRDRLIQHAITEAYRNILPPTVFPGGAAVSRDAHGEVDVNVHPSKTEVRFRQQSVDARFCTRLGSRRVDEGSSGAAVYGRRFAPIRRPARRYAGRGAPPDAAGGRSLGNSLQAGHSLSACRRPSAADYAGAFSSEKAFRSRPMRLSLVRAPEPAPDSMGNDNCAPPIADEAEAPSDLTPALASLKPLGQIRESFILAVNPEGLWIVDQHVAHERVLFEKVLKQRAAQKVESQRLLMPLVIELTLAQQAVFAEIADELSRNGFEVEPFGARTIAVKIAPAGVDAPRSSTCFTNCSTSLPAKSSR